MRHHRPTAVAAAVVALVAVLCPPLLVSLSPAAAAPPPASGEATRIDPSFGGGFASYHLSDLDDRAAAVLIQPDGAVIVVGATNTQQFVYTPADIFVAR